MAVLRAYACIFGLVLRTLATHTAAGKSQQSQHVTPVEKVIELLKKLEEQIGEEGKKEAAQYDKFACFCKEQADDKNFAIEKSAGKIKELTAEIKELEADVAELNGKVPDLGKRMAELEGGMKQASALRAKEHQSYVEEAEGVDGAIDAIQRAIKALKDSKAEMADAKLNLVQVRALAGQVIQAIQRSPSLHRSDAQVRAVTVLLGQPGQPFSYTSHSNDIIATLEGLLLHFKENRKELDEAEFAQQAAFDKEKLSLENEKAFAGKDKAELENVLAQKEEDSGAAKESLAAETTAKDSDEAFMEELTETCETKAKYWDQRSKTRAAELAAIAEALRSLESGVKPNYGANYKLVNLQRQARAAEAKGTSGTLSFLQRGSSATEELKPTHRVLELLAAAAERLRSPILSTLTVKVQTQQDHFAKVRGIIRDLLAKLDADAEAEATQKSVCDKTMKDAVESRDGAKSSIEELKAETSRKTAEKVLLEDEIAALSAAIADLHKALKEATELRMSEKADNEKTLAEADAGKKAVELALNALMDFYGGASLLQGGYVPPNADREGKTVSDLAPEGWKGEYKGKQDDGTGIMAILEMILSDFERTEEKVAAEEKAAQEEFKKFEADTKADVKAKKKEKNDDEASVATLADALAELEDKTRDTEKNLRSTESELEKLKTMCVEDEESFAERRAQREEELAALKEALAVLENWKS